MTAERLETQPNIRPRQSVELTEDECWRLLASVTIGRVAFTQHAMPVIRPVNHLVDGRKIVIRTRLGGAIASRAADSALDSGDDGPAGSVVCYEADALDPVRRTGWSVTATGLARLVSDPADIAGYWAALQPWSTGEMNRIVTIEPRVLSGLRLVGWCS